jgi:hypothetical protein
MPHGHADLGLTPSIRLLCAAWFGRLFPTLPPFAADTKLIRRGVELGAAGAADGARTAVPPYLARTTEPTTLSAQVWLRRSHSGHR